MTHTPPVPPQNQSPYPLHEPPHEHHAPLPEKSAANDDDGEAAPAISAKALGIGAAVGIGSAAIVAGLLYARSGDKSGKAKRSTPKAGTAKTATPKAGARKPRAAASKTVRKPAARKPAATTAKT
ncbi:hypothetical protein ACVWZA_002416 [Sphingomonas sp. UYAg733]